VQDVGVKPKIVVQIELGKHRVFAAALEWPGWCRRGNDEASALEALLTYGPRYASAIGRKWGFDAPVATGAFRVVDRVEGNATTDFGAPGIPAPSDARPLAEEELKRLQGLLRACWKAFDRSAKTHATSALTKGPRGGGRDVDGIVAHVLGADAAYLSGLGEPHRKPAKGGGPAEMAALRREILAAVAARAHGDPPSKPRRSGNLWTPRFAVRRSAWHALDHAWEIEDRSQRTIPR
jgi:hypothetical protein